MVAGTPGTTEVYFLSFAGDGTQGVFAKEVRFARCALSRRLDLRGRTVELATSPKPNVNAPLATLNGLRRAIAGVGAKMNREEDVLLLYLTSHGSRDAKLTVDQPGLALKDVRAAAVTTAT